MNCLDLQLLLQGSLLCLDSVYSCIFLVDELMLSRLCFLITNNASSYPTNKNYKQRHLIRMSLFKSA